MFRFPATAWLIAALLLPTAGATCPEPAPPHARVKDSGSEPDVIRTRDEFDRWMHACPQVLAPLGSLARERFLQHMEFNENGVTGYPVAELEEALTTAEISAISKRLGLESVFPGLTPEEAERLRTHPRLPEASAIELKHDRFVRELMRLELERESAEIGAELAILYRSLFATDLDMGPGGHDGHDLGLLFQATTSTVFHGNDDRLLQEATGIYHELSRRGLATRARSLDLMKLMLDAGRLDDARGLAETTPGLPRLPPTHAPGHGLVGPAVWDLEAEPGVLVQRQIRLSPFHVVAHVSLGCAFSKAAMEAISQDPELGPLFRSHATWMVPATDLAGYLDLREWNQTHGGTPLAVMTRWADWPMLDEWEGFPSFHVFRDGELVETVTGWPIGDGNREAVLAALERAAMEP